MFTNIEAQAWTQCEPDFNKPIAFPLKQTEGNRERKQTRRYQPSLGKGLKETHISQDRRLFWRPNSLGEEEEDWDEEEDEDWEEDEWSGQQGSGQESF